MKHRARFLIIVLAMFGVAVLWFRGDSQSGVRAPSDIEKQAVPATPEPEHAPLEEQPSDRSRVPSGSNLATLRVSVRDNYQQSLGGIHIVLRHGTDPALIYTADHSLVAAHGVTDAKTGEVAYALKTGKYLLSINMTGPERASFGWIVEPISIAESSMIDLERTLLRCDASVTVRVEDRLGVAVPGIDLSIAGEPRRPPVRTDSQGTAILERILPGRTWVEAHRSEATSPSVAVLDRLQKTVDLDVGKNAFCLFVLEGTGALDTRVDCAESSYGESGQIFVHLLYQDGVYDQRAWIGGPLVSVGETFRFENLAPGDYEVQYNVLPESQLRVPTGEKIVTIEAGKVTTHVARTDLAPGVVSGRVSYEGLPVALVPVTVVGRSPPGLPPARLKSMRTDEKGRFEFRGLPAMPYVLYVKPELVPGEQNFAYFWSVENPGLILPGPVTGLEIEVTLGGMLRGVLVDVSGTFEIWGDVVLSRSGYADARVTPDPGVGSFEFGHLRAGSYVLTYRRAYSDDVVASRNIVIDAAAKPVVEIRWNIEKKD